MLIKKSERKKEYFGKNDLIWDYPMSDEKIGIAFHEISGRSPESGWVRNDICYEAYYIISGEAQVFVEDKKYNVGEGDVFVVDKKEKSYLVGRKLKLLTITLPNWYGEQCEIIDDFSEKNKRTNLYEETKMFVKESFAKKGKTDMKHFESTVYWVKKLYPEADEALLVAAIGHDIERAFREDSLYGAKNNKKGFLDSDYIKRHQEKGAKIIVDFLLEKGANAEFAEKVGALIARHEVGGNKEQNILKDADSVSFFENNAGRFAEKIAASVGKEKVREKFDWTFSRITSLEAKKIAQPWYKKAIESLNK